MTYRWQGDDWMFSALLFGEGGTMLSAGRARRSLSKGRRVSPPLTLIDRMVKDGKMPALTSDATIQAFTAGKTGMFFWTTGALRQMINGVGTKFELRTTAMPVINAPRRGACRRAAMPP